MDVYSRLIVTVVSVWSTSLVLGNQLSVKLGSDVVLDLPSVLLCGPYTLLSPLLKPVVIIDNNSNSSNIIGDYRQRAFVQDTPAGFRFTLKNAGQGDIGRYKVATSDKDTCIDRSYYVTLLTSNEEYFTSWSEWSICEEPCNSNFRRSRSRACVRPGGCSNLGPTKVSEKCDRAPDCGHWSEWGQWGECSAKCGKGFKMRKRACVSGNSVLVPTSMCSGFSTQSFMCLTVCQVIGTWSEWGEWSACDCSGAEAMVRTRNCSTDTVQRIVTENCTGNATQKESCPHMCIDNNITSNDTVVDVDTGSITSEDAETTMSISSMVAGIGCAVAVIIILVVVLLLKRRTQQRRESVPALRPPEDAQKRRAANASRQKDKPKKSGGRRSKSGSSGNFYSELTSGNLQWPSSEFDSTYAVFNEGFNPESENERNESTRAALENVAEETIDDGDDVSNDSAEFHEELDDVALADRATMCERKEITYATQRVSFQRPSVEESRKNNALGHVMGQLGHVLKARQMSEDSEGDIVTENVFYEPPELWEVDHIHSNGPGSNDDNLIYDEPPAEDEEMRNVDEKFGTGISEGGNNDVVHKDSVYENCGFKHGVEAKASASVDKIYDSVENIKLESSDYKSGNFNDGNEEINDSAGSSSIHRQKESGLKARKNGLDHGSCPRYSDVLGQSQEEDGLKDNSKLKEHLDNMYSAKELDSEHVYVNGKVKNPTDFYVTPKYHYGMTQMQPPRVKKESIYDVPK